MYIKQIGNRIKTPNQKQVHKFTYKIKRTNSIQLPRDVFKNNRNNK